ncbi:hypothetical protein [Paludibacterium denitrificans]|uniref:Uncharacterized protein n=1 Tax=Paludibacterium denitrificans TaxID=2675226 RepID=A0A844G9H6_9NEIS|nr:hypothetical protein [Paludibacterium denitrificans]MTD33076.1 hypothetical protein [Paludibacterium denitrificans]
MTLTGSSRGGKTADLLGQIWTLFAGQNSTLIDTPVQLGLLDECQNVSSIHVGVGQRGSFLPEIDVLSSGYEATSAVSKGEVGACKTSTIY